VLADDARRQRTVLPVDELAATTIHKGSTHPHTPVDGRIAAMGEQDVVPIGDQAMGL
jgi:hypothetical protein